MDDKKLMPMAPVSGLFDVDCQSLIGAYGSWDNGTFVRVDNLDLTSLGITELKCWQPQVLKAGKYYTSKERGYKGILDVAYLKRKVLGLQGEYDAEAHFGFEFTSLCIHELKSFDDLKERLQTIVKENSTTFAQWMYMNDYRVVIGAVGGSGKLLKASQSKATASISGEADGGVVSSTLSAETTKSKGDVLLLEDEQNIVIGIRTLRATKRVVDRMLNGNHVDLKIQSADDKQEEVVDEEFEISIEEEIEVEDA